MLYQLSYAVAQFKVILNISLTKIITLGLLRKLVNYSSVFLRNSTTVSLVCYFFSPFETTHTVAREMAQSIRTLVALAEH